MDRSPSPQFSPLAFDEGLTPLPEIKKPGTTTLDFSGLLDEPVKLHEDLKTGCGGRLWPAGMVLAKHMLRYHRDKLHEARILELGAGGGLVGLAVAKGCSLGAPLYLTDQLEMEELMKHNVTLNGLDGQVKARILNWVRNNRHIHKIGSNGVRDIALFRRGEPLSQEIIDHRPDTILAADCVYFEPAFPLLMRTLKDLLELCPSTTVYFCFKKRRRADMQFLRAAKKAFEVVEVDDDDKPVYSRESLFLYTFQKKR